MNIEEVRKLSKVETHRHFSFTIDLQIKARFNDDCYRIGKSMGDVINEFIGAYNSYSATLIEAPNFKPFSGHRTGKKRGRLNSKRLTVLLDEIKKAQFDLNCTKLGVIGSDVVENFMITFSNTAYKTRKSIEEMREMAAEKENIMGIPKLNKE